MLFATILCSVDHNTLISSLLVLQLGLYC